MRAARRLGFSYQLDSVSISRLIEWNPHFQFWARKRS